MGTSQRKAALDYFGDVATAPEPPSEDSFYERLRFFQQGLCSGCELRNEALPIVKALVENNPQTGRLQWLLHTTTLLVEKALADSVPSDAAIPAALFVTELTLRNVLLTARGNSTALLQLLEGSAGRNPTTMTQDCGATLCASLMDFVAKVPLTLETAVVHHGAIRLLLTMTSSALHHSTEFNEDRIDVFTEMIMSSTVLSAFIAVLLQRVSEWGRGLAVDANSTALMLYAEGQAPSLSNLFGWLGGAGSTLPTKEEEIPIVTRKNVMNVQLLHKNARTGEIVGRLSAELLAVLLAHQKGNGRNPAIECVKATQSTKELSFNDLLKALSSKLTSCPALCMILYVFLHDHPSFLRTVIASAPAALVDVAQSVTTLLFLVSTAALTADEEEAKKRDASNPAAPTAITVERDPLSELMMGNIVAELIQYAYPFIGFMTSSLLLILSEDRVVNNMLCDAVRVPCFAEKRLPKTLSLGSQLVFALCSAITRGVFESNTALVDVLIPVLGNISAFVHGMELQVAQRLLQLVQFLLKRVRWADEAYQPSSQATQGVVMGADADPASIKDMGDHWVRHLRGVLECVESMMTRGGDRHNESLVYEVLYSMDRILPQPQRNDAAVDGTSTMAAVATDVNDGIDPALKVADDDEAAGPTVGVFESQIQPTIRSLRHLLERCEQQVFSVTNVSNVQEILNVIRQTMSTANPDGHGSDEQTIEMEPRGREVGDASKSAGQELELVFTYEESPHSYNFFGPFVWANVLPEARRPGALLWCTQVCELPLFPQ